MRISDWSSDVCSSDLCQHRDIAVAERGFAIARLVVLRMRQLERRIEQRGIGRAVVATQRTESLELGVRGGRRIGQRLTTLDRRQQRLGISLHLELGLCNLQRLADIGRHFIKTALTRCLVLGLADHDQLAGADRDRLAVLALLPPSPPDPPPLPPAPPPPPPPP